MLFGVFLEMFRNKVVEKTKTDFMLSNLSPKILPFMGILLEPDRPEMAI
jgi:hypothetical protein